MDHHSFNLCPLIGYWCCFPFFTVRNSPPALWPVTRRPGRVQMLRHRVWAQWCLATLSVGPPGQLLRNLQELLVSHNLASTCFHLFQNSLLIRISQKKNLFLLKIAFPSFFMGWALLWIFFERSSFLLNECFFTFPGISFFRMDDKHSLGDKGNNPLLNDML